MEEQLIEPLPPWMDLCRDGACHDESPRHADSRRDRSAHDSRPTAAASLLIGDGFCIPSRPSGRLSKARKSPGIPTNCSGFCPAKPKRHETWPPILARNDPYYVKSGLRSSLTFHLSNPLILH